MKKRTCRYYCPTCFLSFEDNSRFARHKNSKTHKDNTVLNQENDERQETTLVEHCDVGVDDVVLCPDECDFFGNTVAENNNQDNNRKRYQHVDDSFNADEAEERPLFTHDDDDINYDSSGSSTPDSPTTEEESTCTNPTDFYPFPSKTFFLLYCYVHNICRPQVILTYGNKLNYIYNKHIMLPDS